jgi:hypothetical protein
MQFRFKNIDWKSPKVLWGLLIVLLPEIIIAQQNSPPTVKRQGLVAIVRCRMALGVPSLIVWK